MKWWRVPILTGALSYLTLNFAFIGIWAQFFPHAFYQHFPGFGVWVAGDGPYNEHLVRDVGGLNLSLAVLTLLALWKPSPTMLRVAGLTVLISGVPHLLYHAVHLSMLVHPADRVSSTVGLVTTVLAAFALLLPASDGPGRSRKE